IGSPTSTRTWIDRLTAGRPAVGRSGNGGPPGYRPPRDDLARIICTLVRSPCPVVVSIHTLLLFRQALSPDYLTGRIGAASGLRSDVFCLASRNSAIELWPRGGQGTDSNLRTPKGRRLRRRCFGLLHTCPCWLRRAESNGLPLGYEPSELPVLHSASPLPTLPRLRGRVGREGHLYDGAPLPSA